MDPVTAQTVVSRIYRAGIEERLRHTITKLGYGRKTALYEIIMAAQFAGDAGLAAVACVMYEQELN